LEAVVLRPVAWHAAGHIPTQSLRRVTKSKAKKA